MSPHHCRCYCRNSCNHCACQCSPDRRMEPCRISLAKRMNAMSCRRRRGTGTSCAQERTCACACAHRKIWQKHITNGGVLATNGMLHVVDRCNNGIRKLRDGVVSTHAGIGESSFRFRGGGDIAQFSDPTGYRRCRSRRPRASPGSW
jgi:hypothetical protein